MNVDFYILDSQSSLPFWPLNRLFFILAYVDVDNKTIYKPEILKLRGTQVRLLSMN